MSRAERMVSDVMRGLSDDNPYGFERESCSVVMAGNVLTLDYMGVEIRTWGETEFLLSTSDCSNCGAYHLNCVDVERVCVDWDEAMETAMLMYNEYGR